VSGAEHNPLADALDNPVAAPVMAEAGEQGLDNRRRERPPFPRDCPIKPLGNMQGLDGSQRMFYLNFNGQIVGLEAGNKHGKNGLVSLFGPELGWLEDHFPRWSAPKTKTDRKTGQEIVIKPSEIVGFDQAEASEALIVECVRLGIFDPAGRLRGRGAHPILPGGLAIHCGDKLLVSELGVSGKIKKFVWVDPGLHGGFVYPAAAPIPRPHHEEVGGEHAIRLLKLLRTWHWKRELLDPRLLLGAIALGYVGGASPWRSNIWITGGRGTGKSTLNGQGGVVHQLFGEGVFRTGNASAAAIRQSLKNSTVPVMLDEIEAGADNRRVNEVIELARVSSSGDTMHRGGQDHVAHEFTLRSPFWFSSINIPPLQPQDRSRLAILELRPLKPENAPPVLAEWNLPAIGRALARRMMDGWHRLEATKAKYHVALAKTGHDARACDQFGTLLACADLAMEDHSTADGLPDDEDVAHWVGMCRPDRMAEITEATPDHEACLGHLLTSIVQARGGDEREALGTWIGRAVSSAVAPLIEGGDGQERYAERLQQIGLKLVNARYYPEERDLAGNVVKSERWGCAEFRPDAPGFLAVAWAHQGLARHYEGTLWQGIWRQSLGRTDGAIDSKAKFGRQSLSAVLVPLWAVLDESELPHASLRDAHEAWLREQVKGAGA